MTAGNRQWKAEELQEIVRALRERVRARYPEACGGSSGVPLPDLMPIVHARDAAIGKVAAIGSVNPRPGGPLNAAVQAVKKLVARALDWHVREQVEFNRHMISCVEAIAEALSETNRLLAVTGELIDMRSHWAQWREDWEEKLQRNEAQFLRTAADLQAAFQHRVGLMEANFRDHLRSQHADFTGALDRATLEIQKKLWEDFEKIRIDYERLIYRELRLVRQRSAATPPAGPAPAAAEAAPQLDWHTFAERFRGTADSVKERQRSYVPYFHGRSSVLDLGCGRGEFLELMREAGVSARGIDLSAECVEGCRAKGLAAEQAGLFEYLEALPAGSLDGVFCAQVIEHLPAARLPDLFRLVSEKLQGGGMLVVETPNPECLAIFATHFYQDPTHTRPVPHQLTVFYMEEAGFGGIEVKKLAPAVESMPSLASLPEGFRNDFFGGLDYAAIGRKL